MKLEKTAREVLVTLSVADQDAFGIHYNTMSFSDPQTRRFCEHVAVLVCLREGVCEAGNVTVRAVENPAGELLLYFSLPHEPEGRQIFSGVIEFPDADALLDCRRVFVVDVNLCVEVYFYRGKYYLWYEYYTDAVRFDNLTLDLLEYGGLSLLDRTFLTEHAYPMASAVSLFLN